MRVFPYLPLYSETNTEKCGGCTCLQVAVVATAIAVAAAVVEVVVCCHHRCATDMKVCIPATGYITFTVFLAGDDDRNNHLVVGESHGPPTIDNVRVVVPVHCTLGITPDRTYLMFPHIAVNRMFHALAVFNNRINLWEF